MAFDNLDDLDLGGEPEEGESPVPPPQPEQSNRAFVIIATSLGGVAVLAMICIAIYALVLLPQRRNQQAELVAARNAQNTQVAAAITGTSAAVEAQAATQAALAAATNTSTPTKPPASPIPSPTQTAVLVVQAPTNTPTLEPTKDPRTATVAALLTRAAGSQRTPVPAATALPKTGIGGDFGLPTMVGLVVLLIVVIVLARRLRMAA